MAKSTFLLRRADATIERLKNALSSTFPYRISDNDARAVAAQLLPLLSSKPELAIHLESRGWSKEQIEKFFDFLSQSESLKTAADDEAEVEVEPLPDEEPVEDASQNEVLQSEVLDFARLHRSEVFRCEEPVPTRLRDLKTMPGSIELSDYMTPNLLKGSNLSGDTTHVANYEAFLKRHSEDAGVFKLTGGFAAFGIAIRLSAFTQEIFEELQGLEEYSSLDDDVTSRVEKDAIEDAWLDWARFDFINALQAHLPEDADAIDGMTDEQVMELFTTLRKRINAEWVYETGGKAYIDLDRVAAEAKSADIPSTEVVEDEEPVEDTKE